MVHLAFRNILNSIAKQKSSNRGASHTPTHVKFPPPNFPRFGFFYPPEFLQKAVCPHIKNCHNRELDAKITLRSHKYQLRVVGVEVALPKDIYEEWYARWDLMRSSAKVLIFSTDYIFCVPTSIFDYF